MRKIAPFLLLDAWRGIAALWVVMVHACVAFLVTGDNGRFVSFPLYALSIWGQLGVAMFFVISGYCITGAAYGALASGRTAGRYGLDRIRRIYPPYLAACIAALALGLLMGLAQSHHLLPPANHPPAYQQALYQPGF
jgi:peptidoglycan/LPS O-acetylase OafA/YrhL